MKNFIASVFFFMLCICIDVCKAVDKTYNIDSTAEPTNKENA